MSLKRKAGILLHITSLPSRYGIGDLGPESFAFADFLEDAGQTYWQILPISPTEESSGNSPYSGLSAFAGNILLISPELLVQEGLLQSQDLPADAKKSNTVDFARVTSQKIKLLKKSWHNFNSPDFKNIRAAFEEFCTREADWLEDYSLYAALKNHFGKGWIHWPEDIKNRKKEALKKIKTDIAEQVRKEQFYQFLFYHQWFNLKAYCNKKGIQIFGDIPFYVGYESADVWAKPDIFKLNKALAPTEVSGVPPDFFSETGQLWGTPVFDWENNYQEALSWWVARIKQCLRIYDLLRLDHFRAFSAYWEVPASEETAMNGYWVKGPGADFFKRLKKEIPHLPLVAEDLGDIDQPVRDLMDQFKLPGMRILQFAFGDNTGNNLYAPHNHVENCLVYTGTHDNNTVKGWYKKAGRKEKQNLTQYTGRRISSEKVHEVMIQLALSSVAHIAVVPIQDYLGLGEEALMNRPSVAEGNWKWKLSNGEHNQHLAKNLARWMKLFGRERTKGAAK